MKKQRNNIDGIGNSNEIYVLYLNPLLFLKGNKLKDKVEFVRARTSAADYKWKNDTQIQIQMLHNFLLHRTKKNQLLYS